MALNKESKVRIKWTWRRRKANPIPVNPLNPSARVDLFSSPAVIGLNVALDCPGDLFVSVLQSAFRKRFPENLRKPNMRLGICQPRSYQLKNRILRVIITRKEETMWNRN